MYYLTDWVFNGCKCSACTCTCAELPAYDEHTLRNSAHPGVHLVDSECEAGGVQGPAKVGDQQVGCGGGHAVEGDNSCRKDSQQSCNRAHNTCQEALSLTPALYEWLEICQIPRPQSSTQAPAFSARKSLRES